MLLSVMVKLFELSSLRGKITSAYLALVISTATLGIIAFSDLLFLERQVAEGDVVTNMKDKVLEMRREEKNLFLYSDTDALYRAASLAESSLEIIRAQGATLEKIMHKDALSSISDALTTYRSKLKAWETVEQAEQKHLQGQIRELGHRIYLAVESLASQERRMLETAVRESQWFLLISIFLIGLSIYIVGRKLRRAAVKPLQQLEFQLNQISKGRFDHLDPPSSDREFISFTEAFNRMLKELEIRQKRMLQSEKLASLGILASGVAHELNNPLSNISSSCQLLLEEMDEAAPEQLNTWLKQIDSETERGRKIVRTLLDFGSQRVFQKSHISLQRIISDTRFIIEKIIQEQSAELIVDVAEDLYINADKQRIQQLFINLIQNALHAGGQGVKIEICGQLCDSRDAGIPEGAEVTGNLKCISEHSGRFIKIQVSDNGPGISTDNLSKILDPFFTTDEPGHGAGLGLFIVQEIVSEHSGCLTISSKQGLGTQVIILLPCMESEHV